MPHLIIESSSDLSSEVVEKLHQLVGEQETVSLDAVKTRLYSPTLSFSGKESSEPHTAITLKLLSGRDPQLLEQMASNLYERASELILKGKVSVEVVNLGIYKK